MFSALLSLILTIGLNREIVTLLYQKRGKREWRKRKLSGKMVKHM